MLQESCDSRHLRPGQEGDDRDAPLRSGSLGCGGDRRIRAGPGRGAGVIIQRPMRAHFSFSHPANWADFGCLLLIFWSIPAGEALAQDPAGASSPPTWEELRSRPYPPWFVDGKLGIFIHWGIYSVPAYSGEEDYAEWFVRGLQVGDTLRTRFMRENFGEDFTYPDFAPLFRAELFDPDQWADLFLRAGARYVVMVSKHHDGYALWPSRYSPGWNSVDVGPGRDLVGELTRSVRGEGLQMGLYYSLAEWNNPLHRWYTDPPDS
ncbi:MAG: hypothetical protein E4G90_11985, partial [Gemmatimonadales bacterium]